MELPIKIKEMHFLVCDDYESMRTMIVESLKSLGVQKITTANSGNEGFRIIQTHASSTDPIKFVITDLIMEDGTGIDLTRLIRANSTTQNLPILMVTSKSEVNYVLESVKAGVNSYIVKPWALDDLHKKIVEIDSKKK
jgi:two-component system, chemotaxis family, chemotaxis protein CheY